MTLTVEEVRAELIGRDLITEEDWQSVFDDPPCICPGACTYPHGDQAPLDALADEDRIRAVLAEADTAGMENEYWHSGGGIWLGAIYPDGGNGGRLYFGLEDGGYRCTYEAQEPLDNGLTGYNVMAETRHSRYPAANSEPKAVLAWLTPIFFACRDAWALVQRNHRDGYDLEAY